MTRMTEAEAKAVVQLQSALNRPRTTYEQQAGVIATGINTRTLERLRSKHNVLKCEHIYLRGFISIDAKMGGK